MYNIWYDEDGLWKVEKPEEVLAQFKSVNKRLLETETIKVLEEICRIFVEEMPMQL